MGIWAVLQFISDTLSGYGRIVLAMTGLTVLEVLVPRSSIDMRSRLRGAVYFTIQFWISATILYLFYQAMSALHVRPVLGTEVVQWMGWAGAGAMALAAIVYILVMEFFTYWFHRLLHVGPFWRLHAVHHSIREMSAVSCYAHFGEEVVRVVIVAAPMLLLGVTPFEFPLLVVFWMSVQNSMNHAATRFSYGPLGRWLVDNSYHRIHHSLEERHFDKNFGIMITLWDRVFGTAYFPAKTEWPDTGLADQREPQTVTEFAARPFMRS